nr:unnamed protein product [Callosobruchus analis]
MSLILGLSYFDEEGYFCCATCHKRYKRKHGLNQHQRLECNKPPQFCCKLCPKAFKQKNNLKVHVYSVHKVPFINPWWIKKVTTAVENAELNDTRERLIGRGMLRTNATSRGSSSVHFATGHLRRTVLLKRMFLLKFFLNCLFCLYFITVGKNKTIRKLEQRKLSVLPIGTAELKWVNRTIISKDQQRILFEAFEKNCRPSAEEKQHLHVVTGLSYKVIQQRAERIIRSRTTISEQQVEILKAVFNVNQLPSKEVRVRLEKETGLPLEVIRVWFKNRRREKKYREQKKTGVEFWEEHW